MAENSWEGILPYLLLHNDFIQISDRWYDLFYNSISTLIAFIIPVIGLYLSAKLLGFVTADLKDFLVKSMQLEFTTEIGRINFGGLILLFFFLSVACSDMDGSMKGLCFGSSLLGSLLITYCANRNKS